MTVAADGRESVLREQAGLDVIEIGDAPPSLVDAEEVLAENRFIAARDGAFAELVDPATASRIPVARLLDELLPVARPHAVALYAVEELDAVRTLVLAPETAHQERLAESAGIPTMIGDLAARFVS